MRIVFLVLLMVSNILSFTVKPASLTLSRIDKQTASNAHPDSGWTLSVVELDNLFYTGCYWGVTKLNVGSKVVYKPAVYITGRHGGTLSIDTVINTYDSLTFPELAAAPAGKVQVSIVKSDSIYLIISDTLKTTIYAYWITSRDLSGWHQHTVINTSYPSLEYATVSNSTIVFNYPNANGWTISNGNLIKNAVTYSNAGIYAVGRPIVDYKNNVWFYGRFETDTILVKLESWNNFQNAFTYIDSATGYVKFLMNFNNDLVAGYVGKGYIFKSSLTHPATYIGPDTIRNETGCNYNVSNVKVKLHQDTATWIEFATTDRHLPRVSCLGYTTVYNDSSIDLRKLNTTCVTEKYFPNRAITSSTIYIRSWDEVNTEFVICDSIKLNQVLRCNVLNIDSIPIKTLNAGSQYIDTVIAYGDLNWENIHTYAQRDSFIQTVAPGTHPDITQCDGQNIYIASNLPSWITATKINPYMIVLSGTVPNTASLNTSFLVVDSMVYKSATSLVSPIDSIYRTASVSLKISIIPLPNHSPVAANDTSISISDGESYQYTLNATDADADPLTYSYSASIPVVQNNNIFTLSPETHGTYTVKLFVSDGQATDSCVITIIVQAPTSIINHNKPVSKKMMSLTIYDMQGRLVSKSMNTNRIQTSIRNGHYVAVNNQKIVRVLMVVK